MYHIVWYINVFYVYVIKLSIFSIMFSLFDVLLRKPLHTLPTQKYSIFFFLYYNTLSFFNLQKLFAWIVHFTLNISLSEYFSLTIMAVSYITLSLTPYHNSISTKYYVIVSWWFRNGLDVVYVVWITVCPYHSISRLLAEIVHWVFWADHWDGKWQDLFWYNSLQCVWGEKTSANKLSTSRPEVVRYKFLVHCAFHYTPNSLLEITIKCYYEKNIPPWTYFWHITYFFILFFQLLGVYKKAWQ